MAPTKPRFGGGRIMDNKTIKKVYLPIDLEGEFQPAGSMEASLHIQSGEPFVSGKEKEEVGLKNTETRSTFELKYQDSVSLNSLYGAQSSHEKEKTTFQTKEELPKEERGCEEWSCRDDKSILPALSVSRSSIQKDDESNNDNFEPQQYKPGESFEHGNKVKRLMSVLQSLGIYVVIKPYLRSAQTSTMEKDSTVADVNSKDDSKNVSLGDMDASSSPKRLLEVNSLEEDKNHPNNNFVYCKNLFLKDRQDHYYLIIAEESSAVDFKVLKKQLNAVRSLSFADVITTENILGERPGGINPFVAMRESTQGVRFVLHQSLLEAKDSKTRLAFHPLNRSLQIEITIQELITFLEYFDKPLEILPGDIKNSNTHDNLSSISYHNVEETHSSEGNKQSKMKAKIKGTKEGHSQDLKPKQGNGLMNPTLNGNPLWKVQMRKVKLKSFIKATEESKTDNKTSQSRAIIEENSEKEFQTVGERSTSNPCTDAIEPVPGSNKFVNPKLQLHSQQDKVLIESEFFTNEAHQHCNLPETSNPPILPEITQFYKNLSDMCIVFQDLDMHMSTTREIGPSIGCKCFFLKDRRQNYYLIITHEYYELDHGRLKKALKPRKKLDHAEPSDILENLGVQPSRITPFSCTTDRAIANNVMVFITDKILPPQVILCIQHPFSRGRRLVMKSGELQRYLSTLRTPVGKVEEKAWPDKYNRIFTRFTDQSYKLPSVSQDMLPASGLQKRKLSDSNDLTLENEFLQKDSVIERETEENNTSLKTKENLISALRVPLSALQKCSKILGKSVMTRTEIDTSLMTASQLENVGVYNNTLSHQGSSVDPPSRCNQDEDPDNTCRNIEESLKIRNEFGKAKTEDKTYTPKNVHNIVNDTTPAGGDLTATCCDDIQGQDMLSKTIGPSLTVEDILQDLRNFSVEFAFTDHTHGRYVGNKLDRNLQDGEKTTESQRSLPTKKTDVENLLSGMLSEKVCDDENIADYNENVEVCSTAYLCDNDSHNHYIIVGGESDYLTKRRLRRIFHLQGGLRIGDEDTGRLTTTPFSLVMALKGRTKQIKSPPNIYVILFTSLYLDPETKCIFRLDQKGSTLEMTSSELEHFITKNGMECWYIP